MTVKLGYLSKSDYENWRFKRVSPLERVLNLNLSRIHFIMKTVRRNSVNGHLKPSMTVYKLWGKDKKTLLQFSKSGDPRIETAYATHFVQPKCVDTASDCTRLDKRSGRNRNSLFSVGPTGWTKDA